MIGQPLSLDYNQDMIIDLFGIDTDGQRGFWVFGNNRDEPRRIPMEHAPKEKLKQPHAHAFLGKYCKLVINEIIYCLHM